MDIIVVLPAYNEEESLPPLLEKLKETLDQTDYAWRVLVVDDGSSDGTAAVAYEYARAMSVTLVKHDRNRGLGAALMTGLRAVCETLSDDGVVVTMDADNTHTPSLIPKMVEKVRGGSDIVIASRYAPGGEEVGLTPVRKLLSRGASMLLKMRFRLPGAQDCSCGYRAYSVSMLRKGFAVYGDNLVEETGFVCMAEILVKLSLIGAKIVEAPLVLRYDLKGGASKMKVGRTILRYFHLARRKRRFEEMAAGGQQ